MKRRFHTLCVAVVASILSLHVSPSAAQAVIYDFCSQQDCSDGSLPNAGLVDVGGILYGTTTSGGASSVSGTMFSIDTATRTEQVLYSFGNSPDGAQPNGDLFYRKGTLYGTTTLGGAYGYGTVFAIGLEGGERVLHSFDADSLDGVFPTAGLVAGPKGLLYGMTYQGGVRGLGEIYSINPHSGFEGFLYSFGNPGDGYFPSGRLRNVKDVFYGTTTAGGANRAGTIFSFDSQSGSETVLYSFCNQQACSDGKSPTGDLIETNGTLYGTTNSGGAYNNGTVFSLDLTSGTETVVYSFCPRRSCADGSDPSPGLIELNNTLYGTTAGGGRSGEGTIFALDPATGAETVLYAFKDNGTSGNLPNGDLFRFRGRLLGTTYWGGTHALGTIFKLKL